MEGILEPFITTTEIRRNHYYSIYYISLARFLVTGIIPLVLLAYWNYNIYKYMKSSSNCVEQNSSRPSRNSQENELARVLLGIVIMFVCCHTLKLFLNFYEAIMIENIRSCISTGKTGISFWIQITTAFNALMVAINSSANMIIYCCLNSNFRKNLLKCRMKYHESSTQDTAITNDA